MKKNEANMPLNARCQELRKAIESSTGERNVHRELEMNPWVVLRLFETSHNNAYIVSHFSLGDEFEADLVVLRGFSGGWNVHFIELEPPALSPFNKSGNYSPRLNHAAGQIRRWKLFTEQPNKKTYLISQLARAAQAKELLWQDGRTPTCSVGWRFDDPRSMHLFHFHIVMGRRQHLNDAAMTQKASLVKTDGFELITYDRVLEWLKKIESDSTYT
jgi:hypothetical protein